MNLYQALVQSQGGFTVTGQPQFNRHTNPYQALAPGGNLAPLEDRIAGPSLFDGFDHTGTPQALV